MNVLFDFIATKTCKTFKILLSENIGEPQNT